MTGASAADRARRESAAGASATGNRDPRATVGRPASGVRYATMPANAASSTPAAVAYIHGATRRRGASGTTFAGASSSSRAATRAARSAGSGGIVAPCARAIVR